MQTHLDSTETLWTESTHCGMKNCKLGGSHRIPNLASNSTLIVQSEARKLLVHLCNEQVRRLYIEKYGNAPVLADDASGKDEQAYYDIQFALLSTTKDSLQFSLPFFFSPTLKALFHRFSHVVGNERLAMAFVHYGGSELQHFKLSSSTLAFCGGMASFHLFSIQDC